MATLIPHSSTAFTQLRQVIDQLYTWLIRQLEDPGVIWLEQTKQHLLEDPSERFLFTRFSAAVRQLGKANLAVTAEDLQTAHALRAGWNPGEWSVAQAARTLLVLSFPAESADRYVTAIEKLFAAADVAEQVALYQSLPLFPHPDRFIDRAIEGLRTNMTAVFNAIALNNPYPADYFDEAAWNQMVLKALFVDSCLSQIQGLDARANVKLARMLSDYAHERWAAGRAVNPQLWRPIGPFAEGDLVTDLARVLESNERFEQEAAALACAHAQGPDAEPLLEKVPELKQQIMDGQLTWASFSMIHP